MLMLSNVLALALILADDPKPAPAALTGQLQGTPPNVALGALVVGGPRATMVVTGELRGAVAPQEAWPLTLPEAIRIGLENCRIARVVRPEVGDEPGRTPGVVIRRLDAERTAWTFKAEIMALVRSIEQQYWALSQQHVALWSRETAVRLGTEILDRERAELNGSRSTTAANVAEAEQQLDNFKLNLVTATSDLMTTEKQLRNILGLPSADNRRILPATSPTEAKLDPNWDECLATMIESQPDLAEQRDLMGRVELKAAFEGGDPTRRESNRVELERQRAFFQQIAHQTTHSLARFFLEIDANYKQYRTAQTLRAAAQKRLEAQRAFHEEGRITIDRLLDAVAQYANAISQESQYKTSYNTSIAALEEAKGTLLAHDGITVLDPPTPRKDREPAKLDRVSPASFEEGPAAHKAKPQPAPTSYKIKAKVGGLKILEVEIEATPASPDR